MTQDRIQPAAENDRSPENSLRIENEVLRRGFTIIPNTVLRTRRISRDAKLLYGILLSYAWQQGSCWPGYDTLTEDLECGRSQLAKWISELKAAGLIAVQRRGQGLTSIYTIKDGPPEEFQKSQNGTTGSPDSGLLAVPLQDSKKDSVEKDSREEDSSLISTREVALSKFRKGTARDFQEAESVPQERPEAAQRQRNGLASVTAVLAETSLATGGPPALSSRGTPGMMTRTSSVEEASSSSSTDAKRQTAKRRTGQAAADTDGGEHERAFLVAYLRDYANEFHDQASLKSSVTRAQRLFARSGLAFEPAVWTAKLYESHRVTRERAAAIGFQGRGAQRRSQTSFGLTNKMPYFFAMLECVLGLHSHAAGEHPQPLSPEEFQRELRTTKRGGAEDLAGRFAHLVHR